MPNWCSTTINFVGTAEDLADLREQIMDYTKDSFVKNDFGNMWLGNIVIGFGFEDEIDSDNANLRCRGEIDYCSYVEKNSGTNNYVLEIQTTTAWSPMMKMWYTIIEKHYDNRIKIYWVAEEPGTLLYISNDKSYFGENYHVDWCIDNSDVGSEYLTYASSAAEFMNCIIRDNHLNIKAVTENDVVEAEKNGGYVHFAGDEWYIICVPMYEANESEIQ